MIFLWAVLENSERGKVGNQLLYFYEFRKEFSNHQRNGFAIKDSIYLWKTRGQERCLCGAKFMHYV